MTKARLLQKPIVANKRKTGGDGLAVYGFPDSVTSPSEAVAYAKGILGEAGIDEGAYEFTGLLGQNQQNWKTFKFRGKPKAISLVWADGPVAKVLTSHGLRVDKSASVKKGSTEDEPVVSPNGISYTFEWDSDDFEEDDGRVSGYAYLKCVETGTLLCINKEGQIEDARPGKNEPVDADSDWAEDLDAAANTWLDREGIKYVEDAVDYAYQSARENAQYERDVDSDFRRYRGF